MIVPAIAVPKYQPRFETLRDSPGYRPLVLGEGALDEVDRWGQHHAQPEPDQQ